MNELDQKPLHFHSRALVIALLAVMLVLACSFPIFRFFERPFLRRLLALPFPEKNQGMVLQQKALDYADVLPVYGSSELTAAMDKRADQFFWSKPTGFQVCPVGAAGNTTIMMAQKIAAQGRAVEGRKVAFILSHTWFRRPQTPESHMLGNFSPLQTISLLQDSAMPKDLELRYVRRLLEYPGALQNYTLINWYLQCQAEGGQLGRLEATVLEPFLWLERTSLLFEDHLNTIAAIGEHEIAGRYWEETRKKIPWQRLIRSTEHDVDREAQKAVLDANLADEGPGDEEFLVVMRSAKEWDDYALLLDTLKCLNAKALIIAVPFFGKSFNRNGVSQEAREYYYRRIEAMSRERGFPAYTFSEQDISLGFLDGNSTHLQSRGWIYVNRLLNDFYHDRLPIPGRQAY